MSRTKMSIHNLRVALFGQILGLLISFVSRTFFINILGSEYLGISGLFTNILTTLSLVELGVGPAITYSLYKPLAENDQEKIKSLMVLYKKVYNIIGILIATLGLIFTPFIETLIKDVPDIQNIHLIYILFVLNTSLSYFFVYKRNLIIANQQRYIATIYRYSFFFILNVFQIIGLYIYKNYFLYLILQVIFTLLENITVAKKVDKLYPYLQDKKVNRLDKVTINEIKRNTKAMLLHKVGSNVVNSTDNILISAMVGLRAVGLYSNYFLIMNALNIIIGQLFTALTASVGNLGATDTNNRSYFIFRCVNFIDFWIYGFSAICLYFLFNPFISLWLGSDMLFSRNIVTVLVINFYIQGMRKSVLTFRDALGLYWYDRYKPLFESVINLVASLILVEKIGLSGIFIGTLISTMTTCFWVEPYVLYKKGFRLPLKSYFIDYIIYSGVTLIAGFVTNLFIRLVSNTNVVSFLISMLICLIVPNVIFLLLFYKKREFKYLFNVAKNNI